MWTLQDHVTAFESNQNPWANLGKSNPEVRFTDSQNFVDFVYDKILEAYGEDVLKQYIETTEALKSSMSSLRRKREE